MPNPNRSEPIPRTCARSRTTGLECLQRPVHALTGACLLCAVLPRGFTAGQHAVSLSMVFLTASSDDP
eukprot:3971184-Prymnesium_polylepis.1